MQSEVSSLTAFSNHRLVASGSIADVARTIKPIVDRDGQASVLVFEDTTGRQIDLDLRMVAEMPPQPALDETAQETRGPGRPKLGVVAREVTLLPRHWEWLNGQSGGASVALRRLVDAARASGLTQDRIREAQAAADRFMAAMAGDNPGYEAATRALYAGDRVAFQSLTEPWPTDIRDHARKLAAPAFVLTA